MKKFLAIGILLCFVVVTSGCCASTASDNPTSAPYSGNGDNKPAVTAAPTPIPTAVPEASPISLSGTGDQATQKFHLQSGLSIFTMKYDGSDNFIVELKDHNGELVDLLANVIGSYDGSQAEGITSDGDYILNVQASGPWTITITQPRPTTGSSAPVTLSGKGPKATQFVYLKHGLATFQMSHDGSHNFIVELYDHNGQLAGFDGLLANKIGSYSGSQAATIDNSGVYLLNVQADGNWQIGVTQ
jgi:hypothetical protein